MEPLLQYDNVTLSYGGTPVVRGVSLSVSPGEILGIVGESGSGKSTLLRGALGLQKGLVTRGDIRFCGVSLPSCSEKELQAIRGAEIGMIFQDAGSSLCPIRTIGSQMTELMKAHGHRDKQAVKTQALTLLSRLRFPQPEEIWRSYPFQLSGGQSQRAAIAMAMLLRPRLLLADEPTSALDAAAQRQVVETLLEIRRDFSAAVILVTHDIGVVEAAADRVLVLQDGCAVEYGDAAQVLHHPKEAYTKALLAAVPRLRRG